MSEVLLSVIIPAYNEQERIREPLREVLDYLGRQEYTHELICVNDGSTDGTLSILETAAREHPTVRVVSYGVNRGKGYAVKQGVLAAEGEFVLFTDADLNTPINECWKLLSAIDGFDIAIGSRARHRQDRPLIRELGSRFLNLIIRALAVPGIRDTQCGFKLLRREPAARIFRRMFLDRFSFDIEMLYLARKLGYKVIEVPVEWHYRGGSKVSPVKDGLRFIRDILKIRMHDYKLGGD